MSASFHSEASFTFKATAMVIDVEDAAPRDHFISLQVLVDEDELTRRQPGKRPISLLNFNIDRGDAEQLVKELLQALSELPKARVVQLRRE
jgi:hypothetical protein